MQLTGMPDTAVVRQFGQVGCRHAGLVSVGPFPVTCLSSRGSGHFHRRQAPTSLATAAVLAWGWWGASDLSREPMRQLPQSQSEVLALLYIGLGSLHRCCQAVIPSTVRSAMSLHIWVKAIISVLMNPLNSLGSSLASLATLSCGPWSYGPWDGSD
jgi:hypothetical protein